MNASPIRVTLLAAAFLTAVFCNGAPAVGGVPEPLPRQSPAYQSAREALPPQFIEHETRRYVVFSDAEPNWTRDQAERLERAHHQFMRFARLHNLDPQPLRHKLVCVLFERREAYTRFAIEHDGVSPMTARWMSGYYSPRFDRIVFYNFESDPNVLSAREKIEAMHAKSAQLGDAVRQAGRGEGGGDSHNVRVLRANHARYVEHVQAQERRVEEQARAAAIATTIHEAIHQLAYHTAVQSPRVQYPLWLAEGLAVSFETDAPAAAFGPDHEPTGAGGVRRKTFLTLLADNRVLPLRELIAIDNIAGADDAVIAAVYHQGYALVTWMSRYRRTQFRDYLLALAQEPAGRLTPERHAHVFENAFGNIEQTERAWLRHELSALRDDRLASASRRRVADADVTLVWSREADSAEPQPPSLVRVLSGQVGEAGAGVGPSDTETPGIAYVPTGE